MEDEDWSKEPSLPKTYTSLLDLEARWMKKKQQEEKECLEEQKQQQQQERENLKQLQPRQPNPQLFHLLSNNDEDEKQEGRRRPYKRSNEVDSRTNAYANRSNWGDDRNVWPRSRPHVVGGKNRSCDGDRRSKREVLAYEKVGTEGRKRDESEMVNEENDCESRQERKEGEVKEPEEVVKIESSAVVVSSSAATDRATKLRVEGEVAGVARNPRAKGKGTVKGRREENLGEMPVPADEKKDVVEEGVEVDRNPRGKRKGKVKARGEERVGEMHEPAEKKDAVEEEMERKEVQVVRNARNKKKGMVKAGGQESVGEMHLSTKEDVKKDDSVVKKSRSELKVKSGGKKEKEGEMSTVVEVKEKKDVSVVRNSRIGQDGVKRESRVKRRGMIKVMKVKNGSWKEKGSKIREESESVKDEVGDVEEKVRNLSMQNGNDWGQSSGAKGKPAKDNESNITAESKSLKDGDGVVEEKTRNGVKVDPGKENEGEIRAEGEVWKSDDVAVEEKMRNGMKIEQAKGDENNIEAEIEVLKDEVRAVEMKSRNLTMPYGNGPRGSNGMKTKLEKERESLKIEVGELGKKLGGFGLKPHGWRGGNGMKRYSNRVHQHYRRNGSFDIMRWENKSSGREMVWVKKQESGDGKMGGTRTSSLD